jgi:hypothetical protein
METRKVRPLSTEELTRIFGGTESIESFNECVNNQQTCPRCKSGGDSIDCSSEGVSGGTTTDSE